MSHFQESKSYIWLCCLHNQLTLLIMMAKRWKKAMSCNLHTCTYTPRCAYTYIDTWTCVYTFIHMCICKHIYMSTYKHTCTHRWKVLSLMRSSCECINLFPIVYIDNFKPHMCAHVYVVWTEGTDHTLRCLLWRFRDFSLNQTLSYQRTLIFMKHDKRKPRGISKFILWWCHMWV